jgi:hypothetical protein
MVRQQQHRNRHQATLFCSRTSAGIAAPMEYESDRNLFIAGALGKSWPCFQVSPEICKTRCHRFLIVFVEWQQLADTYRRSATERGDGMMPSAMV